MSNYLPSLDSVGLTLGVLALLVALLAGWLMTLFSLPGNWVMVTAAVVYGLLIPSSSRLAIGWPVLVALAGLALLGELLEAVLGAVGVRRAGGSRRAAFLALCGSVGGAMLGATLGSVVPLWGTVAGVLLGACLGALAGAMLGEIWKGSQLGQSWRVGQWAFWGRLLGTVAKLAIASAIVVVTLAALCV